jgi:ankyrin repeat protein
LELIEIFQQNPGILSEEQISKAKTSMHHIIPGQYVQLSENESRIEKLTLTEALFREIQDANFAVADTLILAGADVDAIDRDGKSVLYYYAFIGGENTELMKAIIRASKNPPKCLHVELVLAFEDRCAEGILCLLASGASADDCNDNGMSLLLRATMIGELRAALLSGNTETFLLLANARAKQRPTDFLDVDSEVFEVLSLAVSLERADLVKKFLDSFLANAGLAPRAFAVITGDEVIEIELQLVNAPMDQEALRLKDLGKKLWLGTLLCEAATMGNEAVVTFLLNGKADVNDLVTTRGSPLLSAVEGHHIAVVRRLLQAGITPTAREWGNIGMFCASNNLDDISDIFIRHLQGEDWETQPFRQVEIHHSGSQRSDSPTSLASNSPRSSLQKAVTDRPVYSEKHDSIPLNATSFRPSSTERYTIPPR